MQFPEVLCYIILTITVAASYVDAEDKETYDLTQSEPERRITRREAFIVNKYLERLYPKPIYRRIQQPPRQTPTSSNKYRQPRPPRRQAYRKPSKKYKAYHNAMPPKHMLATPKQKRNSKNRYRAKAKPHSYAPSNSGITSFAEPPIEFSNEFPKQSYGEPPVDSYGAPLNPKTDEYDYNKQKYPVWANDEEANFGFSNKPQLGKTEMDDTFVKRIPQDQSSNNNIHHKRPKDKNFKKKKPQYYNELPGVNKRKKIHEQPQEDEIVVGGQYAEPPPRYVAKYRDQPSAAILDTEDELSPLFGFVGSKGASPYINYKNSNMAFSPQNLNDAFSLVDV